MEIYVIQPGDTLFGIANRFGVSLERLLNLNKLPNPEELVIGQAILIPGPVVVPLQYPIVAGDTLYQLATLFGVTVNDIVAQNQIVNPNRMDVGTVLAIPGWAQAPYQVRPGDTLYQIAGRFTSAVALIVRVNHLANPGLIYPGQALIIPQPLPFKPIIEVMGYFQVRQLQGLARSMAANGAFFTYASIFHFPVGTDGSISAPAATADLVNLFKSHDIQPLMVLTNWFQTGFDSELARAVMGNEDVKNRTIQNVLTLLRQYGFAGVNVDFENMYPEDRSLYTRFIGNLAGALHPEGFPVSLAVAPKSADLPNQPWVGAFDYAALGQLADAVFIMTYEWGWIGGPPMAVAPLNQVRRVLLYASRLMPAAKILQGIPLYGYDWTLPQTPDKPAAPVNLVDVYSLAFRYGAVIQYDQTAQSPWFRYRDERGAAHEVWFEDARSVQAKYQLAQELNLRGVGYWSFTNEPYGFPQNWAILGDMFRVIKQS